MDDRLYEAVVRGDVKLLHSLLEEDGTLRVLVGDGGKETPLHIAAQFGHVELVKEILERRPEFACQLNFQDRTPLHLSSAEGHTAVVKALLEKDKKACFVRDGDGMIPLHLAAVKGRVEALKELVIAKKVATLVKTKAGEPLLHLCVKNEQFQAAKALIEMAGDDKEFLCLKDEDENTILHLLTAKRQYQIIKVLFPDGKNTNSLEVNALNTNGSTALDVLRQVPGKCNRIKIGMILRGVKAKRAKELPGTERKRLPTKSLKPFLEKSNDWSNRSREALMVVAILIATVTFQAALNPPGGVWQSDESRNRTVWVGDYYYGPNGTYTYKRSNFTVEEVIHRAGQAVMSEKFATEYIIFMISNTVGFVHSIILILLLLCGFSFKRKLLMRSLMAVTWICVTSMLVTYGCSFFTLATYDNKSLLFKLGLIVLVMGWIMSIALLVIAFLFKFVKRLLHKIDIVYHIFLAMFKVKKWLVSILKFLWNKCSLKDRRKEISSGEKDPVHDSVP